MLSFLCGGRKVVDKTPCDCNYVRKDTAVWAGDVVPIHLPNVHQVLGSIPSAREKQIVRQALVQLRLTLNLLCC